jgi:hypothetical protein
MKISFTVEVDTDKKCNRSEALVFAYAEIAVEVRRHLENCWPCSVSIYSVKIEEEKTQGSPLDSR